MSQTGAFTDRTISTSITVTPTIDRAKTIHHPQWFGFARTVAA